MYYKRTQHSYPDDELINGLAFKELVGITSGAVTKSKQSGRVDTFENSKGKECFHKVLSPQQFIASRDRRHVTTATVGQRAAGLDNMTAQAVAHKPSFDNPLGDFPTPVSAEVQAFDFGAAMSDRLDLENSKAQKEYQMARLAKLKADEMEGRLVPKQVAAVAVYQLAANVQDKVMTIYSWLAPEIVGFFKDRLTALEIPTEKILQICDNADHEIGEKIRKACLTSLKDIASKNETNIIDG